MSDTDISLLTNAVSIPAEPVEKVVVGSKWVNRTSKRIVSITNVVNDPKNPHFSTNQVEWVALTGRGPKTGQRWYPDWEKAFAPAPEFSMEELLSDFLMDVRDQFPRHTGDISSDELAKRLLLKFDITLKG